MKKLMVAMTIVCSAFLAQAEVEWSWWLENPMAKPDLSLGVVTRCQEVKSFEAALFYAGSPVQNGVQFTFFGFNDSESTCPLQLAFVNRAKNPCVQLGFLNMAKAATFDMGFANIADDAKFQLGFLNFNKKGFLPVFIFVNFDPGIFK